MKFTLKDYQEQAVDDVLANLKRARENFKNPERRGDLYVTVIADLPGSLSEQEKEMVQQWQRARQGGGDR